MEEIQITPKPQKSGSSTLLVLIIILLLISNIVTAYFLLMGEDKKVEVVEEQTAIEQVTEVEVIEEEVDIPELQTAIIGEPIDMGDYIITVIQIDEDVDEDAISISLADGQKYVSAEILIENNTDSSIIYATSWTLYDGEGYDYSVFSRREPRFSTNGSIAVNGTTKGWLNFRTTEDATDFTVKFNDDYAGYSVEFSEAQEEN